MYEYESKQNAPIKVLLKGFDNEVVEFLLTEKPLMTHVVLTGRNAKEELIAAADLVTEMTLVKHPFRDGIKAQKGIEF